MKIFFSILLVLITGIYILPVKQAFKSYDNISMADMNGEKEELTKKEKEFYLEIAPSFHSTIIKYSWHSYRKFNLPVSFLNIETPPPDNLV